MARGFRDEDSDDESVTLEGVRCKAATDKALLCVIDGDEHWIPQSQVTADSEVFETGGEGKLIVTAWYAQKAGFV